MNKMPLMKNCRIDYFNRNGRLFTALVDYINNSIVYVEGGQHGLKEMYGNLKFSLEHELPISDYSFIALPLSFAKVNSGNYVNY